MTTSVDQPRVMIWVQHLLGIGHVTRAAVLSRAMIAHGLKVLIVQGGEHVAIADFGASQRCFLPPIRAKDSSFNVLIDDQAKPVTPLLFAKRRGILLEAARAFDPDVVVIEHFPFGRRAFRVELEPLFDQVKSRGCCIVCSVRDVLVDKGQARKDQAAVDLLQRYFDRVLVHGDARLVPFDATFARAGDIEKLTTYTGYVVDERPVPAAGTTGEGHGEIVVSVGGGAVGATLLAAAVEAAQMGSLASRRWRLLHGAQSPPKLNKPPPTNVVIEPARPDFKALLSRAALSISQGGYNTVMDVLQAGCPAVIVPFAEGGESEQAFRARALQKRGLLQVLRAQDLSAAKLAQISALALTAGPPPRQVFDFNGAQATAGLVLELARSRRPA